MYWLYAMIACFIMVIYRYRVIIGKFFDSCDEMLTEYNDQYDHGDPDNEDGPKQE